MAPENSNFDPHRKAAKVGLAIVVVLSVSGYFMGLRQTANTAASRDLAQISSDVADESATAPEARAYSRMREFPKPNSDWSNSVASLKAPALDVLVTNAPATAEERGRAAAIRLERRAFDGAPPVVPHPIDQASAASCLSCHGEGKLVKGRVASKISHQHYGSCTQCHVPAAGNVAGGAALARFPPLSSNLFAGLESYGAGSRAYQGAPPTIPHPTTMRLDCSSCHGSGGAVALRTSHPWRQSCTQCHAPSADLEQRKLFTVEAGRTEELPATKRLSSAGGAQ